MKRTGGGWLHRLDGLAEHKPKSTRPSVPTENVPKPNFSRLSKACEVSISHRNIIGLSKDLEVTIQSLQRLRLGMLNPQQYTFPMTDSKGHDIGIQIRTKGSKKFCVPGSRLGLFMPKGLSGNGPLLITEGASDCLAGLDLSFDCIGRPNFLANSQMVCDACKGRGEIIVVSDNDEVGLKGALELSETLASHRHQVKLITPPDGIKDLRQWKSQGLNQNVLSDIIQETQTITGKSRRGTRSAIQEERAHRQATTSE